MRQNMIQMNLFKTETDSQREQTCSCQGGWDWEGID